MSCDDAAAQSLKKKNGAALVVRLWPFVFDSFHVESRQVRIGAGVDQNVLRECKDHGRAFVLLQKIFILCCIVIFILLLLLF